MDIEEFYDSDDRKYELANNKDFLRWFYLIKKKGYQRSFSEIEEFQSLIDFLATWYEIKYPNRFFDEQKGIVEQRFKGYQCKTTNFKMEDLFYQLSDKQLAILDSNYHGHGLRQVPIINNKDEIIGKEPCTAISIRQKVDNDVPFSAPSMYLFFNPENGILYNSYECDEYFNDKDIILNDIFSQKNVNLNMLYYCLSKKYNDKFDLDELKLMLFTNECDKNIRKYILNLVALKLLYFENTRPEYGYIRAGKFIDDFNEYFIKEKYEDLNLSKVEIKEIINKYLSHKIKAKVK